METKEDRRMPRSTSLKVILYLSIAIALAAAAHRLLVLFNPASASLNPQLDAAFSSRAVLTAAHIIPAVAFVLLLPFVLLWERTARWMKNALYLLGTVVGVTAYGMIVNAFGGRIEQSAVLVFDTLFLASLLAAFRYGRRGRSALESRWLWRAAWILLGIATTRPVMGIFFATSRFTHLEPRQFFGIAFWIGFSLNTIAAEIWLAATSGRTAHPAGAAVGRS
jgi:hypothetical protein